MKRLPKYITLLMLPLLSLSCSHSDSHDHEAEQQKEEHDHEHEGAITLRPAQAKEFGVVVGKVIPDSFSETITVSGRVEPSANDRMIVTARRSGIFRLSPGLTAGSRVSAGQTIGTISSKGIEGGDQNAAQQATIRTTRQELDRLTPLYNDGLVTAPVYNEARRAYQEALALGGGASAGSGTESAPCAGTITDIYVSPGQYVETGAQIACVARNTRLTLRADLPERHVGFAPTIVSANFRPDYTATVFSLRQLGGQRLSTSLAAASNGYIPIYFSFDSNGEVVAGAFAEIYLIGAPRANVISLPREAFVEMHGNKYVYVRVHDDAYEKRLVKTGASDGVRTEILSGIKSGEEVVMKGASVIRMAETSAIAPPGHSHNH